MEKIFYSKLKLNFYSKEIELDYKKLKNNRLLLYTKWISLICFIFNLTSTIEISIFISHFSKTNFKAILFMNYIIFLFSITSTILTFVLKNSKLNEILLYLNTFFITFTFFNIAFPIFEFLHFNQNIIFLFMTIELTLRIFLVVLELIEFKENAIIIIISIIFTWAIYIPISDTNRRFGNSLLNFSYSLILITIIAFAYIIERNLKQTFFYNFKLNKQITWLINALENVNSGFFIIKNGEISYINSYLLKVLENTKMLKNESIAIFDSQIDSNTFF